MGIATMENAAAGSAPWQLEFGPWRFIRGRLNGPPARGASRHGVRARLASSNAQWIGNEQGQRNIPFSPLESTRLHGGCRMTDIRHDLTRNTLAILCILGLIGLTLWVLRPFLAATVWATMIVVATWPLLLSLEARLGQRRALAVAAMSLAMLLLLVLPLWLAIDTIADHSGQLTEAARSVAANGLPLPPDWVATLPLVGEKLAG